jgi:Ca-activated chloride channel family protein
VKVYEAAHLRNLALIGHGRTTLVSAILLAVLFSSVAWTQASPASSIKPDPVTVAFFAWGHDKHPYTDLKLGDITILDNKQPVRSITSLKKGSELPLSIGLLVDASGSQRSSELYQPGLRSAMDFVNQVLMGPGDRVFVVKVTVIPEASEFMSRVQFANFKLNATPQGGTALYDGVRLACDAWVKSDGPESSRRVLIVLSDGDDNLSHISRQTAIEKAVQAGVVIFSVSTEDDWSAFAYGERGNSTLEHFAAETGGESFTHLNRKKIDQSFSAISEAINNMYFVTFEPADANVKGLHRIELRTSGKDTIRLQAPKGFYPR